MFVEDRHLNRQHIPRPRSMQNRRIQLQDIFSCNIAEEGTRHVCEDSGVIWMVPNMLSVRAHYVMCECRTLGGNNLSCTTMFACVRMPFITCESVQ